MTLLHCQINVSSNLIGWYIPHSPYHSNIWPDETWGLCYFALWSKNHNIHLYPGHEVGDSKVVEHGCIRQLITCDFLQKNKCNVNKYCEMIYLEYI
jgi:hypothetical protein